MDKTTLSRNAHFGDKIIKRKMQGSDIYRSQKNSY